VAELVVPLQETKKKSMKTKHTIKNPDIYLVNGKEYELVALGRIGSTDQIALILLACRTLASIRRR